MLANHMLAPVAVDKMPEWAKEYVRGQEDAFVAQQCLVDVIMPIECAKRHLRPGGCICDAAGVNSERVHGWVMK
eukprot:1158066-Pelagomonas_calceolata.AAC.13